MDPVDPKFDPGDRPMDEAFMAEMKPSRRDRSSPDARFAIREGGRTVGSGVVSKITK